MSRDMAATLGEKRDVTRVTSDTPASILNFDVIKQRVADLRGIDKADVTDIVLGDFFGHARETINRIRSGVMNPSLPAALAMAQKLGMSVEEITAGNLRAVPAARKAA